KLLYQQNSFEAGLVTKVRVARETFGLWKNDLQVNPSVRENIAIILDETDKLFRARPHQVEFYLQGLGDGLKTLCPTAQIQDYKAYWNLSLQFKEREMDPTPFLQNQITLLTVCLFLYGNFKT